MTKFHYLSLLVLLITVLSSCWPHEKDKHPAIETDTLVYTYKNIRERATDCGNKPDSACTVVKVTYAQFAANKALNDTVQKKLLNLFAMDGRPDSSLQQMTKKFIQDYIRFKKREPASPMTYELDTHATVLRQDSSLTTLEVGGYTFQGGAHGSTFIGYINWNTKADKNITLSDVLIKGYESKLKVIAEKIFRKQENLSDTSSLARDYFFTDAKFALNQNYLISPVGIKFLYNNYEIKPYAAGRTELLVPYEAIRSLIKPNTVIAQYIK
jgi:hypothetical protein